MESKPRSTRARKTTTTGTPDKPKAARAAKPRAAKAAPAAATAVAVAEPFAPTHEQIAVRAHELFVRSGHQHGREQEFWLEAERQLNEEAKGAHR